MPAFLRATSALVLALAASRADGGVAVAHALSLAAPANQTEELRLDRDLRGLLSAGPFLTYALPAALEHDACAESGKRRQLRGRIESTVIRAAAEQLNLPMGSGRFLAVKGKNYLFCLEPHYHEPGEGRGPAGWHKGVTVYDAS